jgi:hypothetical protein
MRRLVVLRDGNGQQREHVLEYPVERVLVPITMDRGFGQVIFAFCGHHTVQGLPIFEASEAVFHCA